VSESINMADATGVRIRVSDALKTEWKARARADGTSLSHVVRTAVRLAMLVGPARIQEAVSAINAMRHDLHAVATDLHKIAERDAGVEPDRLRAAVASAHEAAEATAIFLRKRQ
jgi:hypothetical protein